MAKIIREILVLVWKALRLVVWRWLAGIFARLTFFALVLAGIVAFLIVVLSR